MDPTERKLDEAQLRAMPTGELVRHALEETRLLVKAEVLHAKQELREELQGAKVGGILLGITLGLALSVLTLLFVALALALPMSEPLAVLLVAAGMLVLGGILAAVGVKKLPRKPLGRTQERLRRDLQLTKEQLV